MFKTKEVARNPEASVKIKCTNCKKEYALKSCLQERQISVEYSAIVEGVLVCPYCSYAKHVYYMTEYLRNEQRLLQQYALDWQCTQFDQAFVKLESKKIAYQHEYDRVQEKYLKEFGDGSDKK